MSEARVLKELKLNWKILVMLFYDNKSAISIVNNPVQHDHSKHIEVDRHSIKEKLEGRIICMSLLNLNNRLLMP